MKILAIGDIHGRTIWKDIVNKEFDNVDRVVFIGDYFDSFEFTVGEQLSNYLDIMTFKRRNPEKVKLLIGNHDYHYFIDTETNTSGFNQVLKFMFENVKSTSVSEHIVAYSSNGILFTHAGLSNTFAKNNDIPTDSALDAAVTLNFRYQVSPKLFRFLHDPSRERIYDPTGDNTWQGPMWIRPRALQNDRPENMIQIVGHTQSESIRKYGFGYCIDALYAYKGEYMIIDSEQKTFDIKNIKR